MSCFLSRAVRMKGSWLIGSRLNAHNQMEWFYLRWLIVLIKIKMHLWLMLSKTLGIFANWLHRMNQFHQWGTRLSLPALILYDLNFLVAWNWIHLPHQVCVAGVQTQLRWALCRYPVRCVPELHSHLETKVGTVLFQAHASNLQLLLLLSEDL